MTRRKFVSLPALAAAQSDPDIPRTRAELQETLMKNILGFWYPRVLDRERGGYAMDFDAKGVPIPGRPKMIVTQARMVWFFARMARAGYGDRKAMLEAADHGYRFLTAKMWDTVHGGFHWEVNAQATDKTRPDKHLYGNSFGLYALSEYALASGRKDVAAFTTKFFELLEAKAHDREYGGYREAFTADWQLPPPASRSYMSVPPDVKLMNTHMHLMEALTTYCRATRSLLGRERLVELIQILSNAVIRKNLTAGADQYRRDWTPILEGPGARVSYGHDLENVWLLKDACDAAGMAFHPLLDLSRELWSYALKYGWDEARGGFYYSGWFRQPALDRRKSWWVQAEALVSALTMWRLSGEESYWRVFEKTWEFLKKYQIDSQSGEWHEMVDDGGRASGGKGHAWKAAYHNGRAMIECIELLKKSRAG